MILAFDTSSEACTAALFEDDGRLLARADERIGRGHAERLVPMIEAMLDGRRPSAVAVGVGPGSFTGIRVAIAAAHGMAIGWDVPLTGFSSLALLAAGQERGADPIGVAVIGGHGQLFVQQFDGQTLAQLDEVRSLVPADAAAAVKARQVIGSGAAQLVEARADGIAVDALPSSANLFALPRALRTLAPRPVYVRAPDARAKDAA